MIRNDLAFTYRFLRITRTKPNVQNYLSLSHMNTNEKTSNAFYLETCVVECEHNMITSFGYKYLPDLAEVMNDEKARII